MLSEFRFLNFFGVLSNRKFSLLIGIERFAQTSKWFWLNGWGHTSKPGESRQTSRASEEDNLVMFYLFSIIIIVHTQWSSVCSRNLLLRTWHIPAQWAPKLRRSMVGNYFRFLPTSFYWLQFYTFVCFGSKASLVFGEFKAPLYDLFAEDADQILLCVTVETRAMRLRILVQGQV